MPDVDIVIVNYMSGAHTVKCVQTVLDVAKSDEVGISVTVIDNGDSDSASLNALRSIKSIHFIQNSTNRGFGAACNQGAAHGSSELILFLNPDATPQSGALRSAVNFLRDHEDCAIVGPEIADASGKVTNSCSNLPSKASLFLRTVGLHKWLPGSSYPYLPIDRHAQSGEVEQVMGAAMFIRRDVFERLEGFDERFFLYYDDVDLCARVKSAGYKIFYLQSSRVMHIGRVSSTGNPSMALALHIRSRLTYAGIYFGRIYQFVLALACVFVELPMRTLMGPLKTDTITGWRALQAYRHLLFGEPRRGAN